MKKKTLSQLKKALDKTFSFYVRWRDSDGKGGNCIACGNYILIQDAQCGHLVSRRHLSTRWEENNAALECYPCNVWRRGNIAYYMRNLEEKIGRKAVDEVIQKSKQIKKYSRAELEGMLDYYTRELYNLQKQKS